MDTYKSVDSCRSCGSQNLAEVLDLGNLYVSDFVDDPTQGVRAPLVMARCGDCTLVQTRHTVDRELLFRDYWYKSGTNESMVAALRDVVQDACSHANPDGLHGWLDIGANDGTLLSLVPNWFMAVGVDPAPQSDIVAPGFFPDKPQMPDGHRYKVITSIAMFYAVDEPHAFVEAIKRILHPEGIWVVQLQDLASVLRDRAFDYFCHEHLCLYSPFSFDQLIRQHGLEIADVSYNSVNGGSVRLTVMHGDRRQPRQDVDNGNAWALFGPYVESRKNETLSLLRRLRGMGQKILGYAASTKGNTLLQYYGITPDMLPAIAERQPAKWGKRTIGSGVPIISEDEARAMKPDYFFCLAWAFADAFAARESVPLILPLPQLEIRSRAREAVA